MNKEPDLYTSADQWRIAAMGRTQAVSQQESEARQTIADAHNAQHGVPDSDTLQDQQLYILGKMDLEEYQNYLLFKHSKA